MSDILTVLTTQFQTHEVVVLERNRSRLRLQCPRPVTLGSAIQLKLSGELLLGEVTGSMTGNDHFEIDIEACEVLYDSWRLHPEWSALDSSQSLTGSLIALNNHLELCEKGRRGHHVQVRTALAKSS